MFELPRNLGLQSYVVPDVLEIHQFRQNSQGGVRIILEGTKWDIKVLLVQLLIC